jgi:sterol desaturase/sphingolipid hydroxylase (fatty acid hydroxylase superfamily)
LRDFNAVEKQKIHGIENAAIITKSKTMTDPNYFAEHLRIFASDVGRLSVWLILLVCIFVPLERLCALHPAKIWRKQVGIDLAWYFINSILPAAIIAIPLAMLAGALDGFNPLGFYSMVAAWPLWMKLPLVFFVNDVGAYWAHRASHATPLLWRFHAVHHSPEHLDWLVNTRAHPFDMVFTRLTGLAPVYLLGLAQTTHQGLDPVIAIVTIVGTIWSFFIHANVRFRLGPLEWLVSTPAFHHWHHTNDEHRDRNFAAIFPVVDRVFGTAWLPKHWPPVYGIDAKIRPTLAGQLFDPLDQK